MYESNQRQEHLMRMTCPVSPSHERWRRTPPSAASRAVEERTSTASPPMFSVTPDHDMANSLSEQTEQQALPMQDQSVPLDDYDWGPE